jgi:hypothetical protein
MPTFKQEGVQAGAFLLSEWDSDNSRETVRLNSGTAGVRVGTMAAILTTNNEAVNYVPGGANGAGTLYGIFYDTYTNPPALGTAPQNAVVVVRGAVVNASELDWNGMAAPQIATAKTSLKNLGIIVKEDV